MNIEPNPMPKEDDPMHVVVTNSGEELECLATLEAKLGEEMFAAYLQGCAMRSHYWYRKTGKVAYLDEMHFYMHRMTHFTMKAAADMSKRVQHAYEVERLNLLSQMHETED